MISNIYFRNLLYWVSVVIIFVATNPSYAGDGIFKGDNPEETISISSKGPWIIDKNHTTIKEDIEATYGDNILKCQKMVIHFFQEANDEKKKQNEPRILKIISSDSVVLTIPGNGTASSEMAIYDVVNKQITLSGNPKLKRNGSTFEPCEIFYYLTDHRIVMNSCDDKRINGTFSLKDIETGTK